MPEEQHPDILTGKQAVAYLLFDKACPNDAAAHGLLDRLVQRGALAGLELGKTRIYHRDQLDALIARTINAAEADRLERKKAYEDKPAPDPDAF